MVERDGPEPPEARDDGATDRPRAPDRSRARDSPTGSDAAANRIRHQTQWVEAQVRASIERGEFDDLPGFGRPLRDLGAEHDPDWWVRRLVEREQISVLPPALAIRLEDARLEETIDRLASERDVRREVEEFNARVRAARIQPLGGPPMVTAERDVEAEVVGWAERRTARRAAAAARAAGLSKREHPRRRWLPRLRPRR